MATKKEDPMLGWLVDLLRVVPHYDFIVTVMAVTMGIYMLDAKLRQSRLEGIIQRLWERRNREIRFKKTQRGTGYTGVNETKEIMHKTN